MYVRKTCKLCKKPTHMDILDDAKCLFEYHNKREGRDHALRCVHLVFGEAAKNQIAAAL